MKHRSFLSVALAGSVLAFTACTGDETSLTSDAELTADVVETSGDAIAADVGAMIQNEVSVGAALPGSASGFAINTPPNWTVNRTRTCFDAAHVAQAACDASTTASIEFTLSVDGSFSRSRTGPRGSESMEVAVHRDREWTISGLAGTETFRVHDGAGSSADTATFSGTHNGVDHTRIVREASNDTVDAVRFNLPRGTNPFPVEGRIIRNVSGTVDITVGDRNESRSYSRRIEVTFPADAQGNVAININGRSCTLNLVTRVVANCST